MANTTTRPVRISLFIGGAPHYEVGLVSGLVEQNLDIDVIGGAALAAASIMQHPQVHYLNLHANQSPASPRGLKLIRVFWAYLRILAYVATTNSKLIHLQWPYKFVFLDRTLFNLYYKILGKKLVFTAHNVDGDARDGSSTWIKRLSLRFQYRVVDHIIVHTDRMKNELLVGFGVQESRLSVIPHGVMSAVPESSLNRIQARQKLRLKADDRVVLFFGLISPYKGLELLVEALIQLRDEGRECKLLIAGRIKECQDYWDEVVKRIESAGLKAAVVSDLRHIPDDEVEVYFKAADALVLPYRGIFQSGVLFLAYRFGLPVIATDVGSFKEDIIPGRTGLVCRADDSADMAKTIGTYFGSELFRHLESRRQDIRNYALERYSWSKIGEATRKVYEQVLRG